MNIFEKLKRMIFPDLYSEMQEIVNYIFSGETLPLALGGEDEMRFISMLETENHELGRSKLIEHNIRLVLYIVKKFENTGFSQDDLVSVGVIGLIKAINSFKKDKEIKLATYASRCIENEILMHLRKNNKFRQDISLEQPLNVDYDGNELSFSDVLANEVDTLEENMNMSSENQMLWSAIEKLDFKDRQIIYMRFGLGGEEGKTQKEVADYLNISQSYISRIEKKILESIKKNMNKYM